MSGYVPKTALRHTSVKGLATDAGANIPLKKISGSALSTRLGTLLVVGPPIAADVFC